MSVKPLECPGCGKDIGRFKITGKPFPCPSCGRFWTTSRFYYKVPGLLAVLVCWMLGYAFGLREGKVLIFIAVMWFPITVFLFGLERSIFTPKLTESRPESLDMFNK